MLTTFFVTFVELGMLDLFLGQALFVISKLFLHMKHFHQAQNKICKCMVKKTFNVSSEVM